VGNINLPETQKVGLSERDDGGSEARAPFGGYENRLKLSIVFHVLKAREGDRSLSARSWEGLCCTVHTFSTLERYLVRCEFAHSASALFFSWAKYVFHHTCDSYNADSTKPRIFFRGCLRQGGVGTSCGNRLVLME
jgi:hypothetical protein